MTTKKQVIFVPSGTMQKLADACGCSKSLVFLSLNYGNNSELGRLIRKRALEEYNGIVGWKPVFD